MYKLLINELNRQNPWWFDPRLMAIDPTKPHRDLFEKLKERVVKRELITSLVGLRRVGKSTLLLQMINFLLQETVDPTLLVYFSFEELPGKGTGDLLRDIVEYQIRKHPKEKSYLFFDEIQYVDRWNSALKRYFDQYPQLKFTISGSSSLFVGTSARESLAGRIQELVLRPMGYGEYLRINQKQNTPENFQQYLAWGEFPYLEKLPDWAEKKEYVSEFVIKKVAESDLPRLKKVYGDELVRLLTVLLDRSGQIVEIQNLATDLVLAQNTVREYLRLLEQTYLISQVFNLGIGFRTRSVRQRKVYSASSNAIALRKLQSLTSDVWQTAIGSIIETFVYNYFVRQEKGEIYFWRQRQVKEIDFLIVTGEEKLPVEVKYQPHIRANDLEHLLYYCRKENLRKAMVVTQDEQRIEKTEGIEITFTPASELL